LVVFILLIKNLLAGTANRRELEDRLFANFPNARWDGRRLNSEMWCKPGMYTLWSAERVRPPQLNEKFCL